MSILHTTRAPKAAWILPHPMPGSRIESHRCFPLLLIAASLAASGLSILRDPLINDDGVLYLVIAGNIAEHGLATAFELFDRPFYPLLIALLHGVTGLSLLASAHLLDAAFIALLVLSFSRLVAMLGADARLGSWAALLILLFPQLNEYRSSLLRDFGYWALLVSSWLVLLRYQLSGRWSTGLYWAALGIAAAAFRPEALIFALLLPALCLNWRTAAGRMVRLYACLALLGLAPLLVLARFGMLEALFDGAFGAGFALADGIAEGFRGAVQRYAGLVLDPHAADLAAPSLIAGLLALLVLGFARTLGLVYCVLLAWGIATRRAAVPEQGRGLLRGALACSLLILLTFLFYRQFLTGRYLVVLCLLALVPCTLILRSLARSAAREGRTRVFAAVMALAIVLLATDSFISFGTRKNHVHDCIAWMDANIGRGARVFSNDRILAYYSGGQFDWSETVRADELIGAGTAPLVRTDYWIVHDTGRNADLAPAMLRYARTLLPLQEFSADNGRVIRIYRVQANGASS